mgnify:CR=1 FL=1
MRHAACVAPEGLEALRALELALELLTLGALPVSLLEQRGELEVALHQVVHE